MSGLAKVVKKAFKFVTKKVLPVAAIAVAAYFTAGAALGLPGAAGGLGAAMSRAASSLGLTAGSTLTNVLVGAATQASYGALGGAVTNGLQGKSILKGAATGLKIGAVTGAATGLVAPNYIDPFNAGSVPQGTKNGLLSTPTVGPEGIGAGPVGQGPIGATSGLDRTMNAASQVTNAANNSTSAAGGIGKWLNDNAGLATVAASGLGNGLLALGQAGAAGEEEKAKQETIDANYKGAGTGLLTPSSSTSNTGNTNGLLSPSERFNPGLGYEYRFNPETRRLERVPLNAAA